MKTICLFTILFVMSCFAFAQDEAIPVRGFCIAAPMPGELNDFIKFVNEELAPRNVNTLILRVDYNYQFQTHPELRDDITLSKTDVKRLVDVCKKKNIQLIPQINMLGHQSWAGDVGKLLEVYPEFDETPNVKMPEKYVWPNSDGLYCKSYCPLHPELHSILFDLIDEICDVFESDNFHAGMDEVFYIGHDSCSRCSGLDKAKLFADEVNKIKNHLAEKNRTLWIWGDRLIDGKTTGMGMWEASMNNTHQAIDLIDKDVMICDWHYDRPDETAVYFALKGFKVVTCPWNKPEVAAAQVTDMFHFRQSSTPEMKERFQGIIQTVWSGVGPFLKEFYNKELSNDNTTSSCFRSTFNTINRVTQ